MVNISNHQGNANKNHNEISSHTSQDGYYKKKKKTSVGEDVEILEPCTLLVRTQNSAAAMENSMEVPQKIKNTVVPPRFQGVGSRTHHGHRNQQMLKSCSPPSVSMGTTSTESTTHGLCIKFASALN